MGDGKEVQGCLGENPLVWSGVQHVDCEEDTVLLCGELL